MTPEEIVDLIARMTDPHRSSDPGDSEETLTRLIRESRAAVSPRRRRREARLYRHESPTFTRAMLLIQDAPAHELRSFVMGVVDRLWGEGPGTLKRKARQLDFDREWDCPDLLSEISRDIHARTFCPFPRVTE